ncbi:hypothetical protein TD95_004449 [Thielaviopsis punctulata]|uniref:NADH dehydrogenase [ubiquinone] 1 alpha subcomplex subunit 1 n=1 Tax=Thielaviopsis punctulata TaxID=72032 RepID=A0A0F4ZBW4_9PEZI|nr:hypothetical protein TD95_004449 [Thielaviopsis punctulata]
MPVPFEALLPYAIVTAMFGATGAGLGAVKYWQNGWKTPRWSLDEWDKHSKLDNFASVQNKIS